MGNKAGLSVVAWWDVPGSYVGGSRVAGFETLPPPKVLRKSKRSTNTAQPKSILSRCLCPTARVHIHQTALVSLLPSPSQGQWHRLECL